MHFKSFAAAAALALGTTLVAPTAFAVPITTGTLGMAFTYQAENAATGANVPLSSATGIDFSAQNAGPTSSANTGSFVVTQATGSFATAGIVALQIGTIRDLVFSPFSPITSFFTIGPVDFDLTGLTVTTQTNLVLALLGTGKFEPGTADETAGTWAFSGQTDGVNLTGTFSWSADANPVPEPATLAILGMGLLGLGLARRRMAKKA